MKAPGKEGGFVTAVVLVLLFGVGILLSSVYRYGTAVNARVDRELQGIAERSALESGIEWFASVLARDSSPGGNSWWDLIDEEGYVRRRGMRSFYQLDSGVEVRVEEVSSRLNPNFDNLDFWRVTFLSRRILALAFLSEWERERLNGGFVSDPEELGWIPHPEDWDRYYTLHSPICINGTSREVIDSYLGGVGWSGESIAQFWGELGSGYLSKKRLNQAVANYGRAPALQVEAGWNVNLMDEALLSELIYFPWGGVGFLRPDRLRQWVVRARVEGEISLEQLEQELAGERSSARQAFLARFGAHSWFWRVEVEGAGSAVVAYLRRIPPTPQEGGGSVTGIQVVSAREILESEDG